MERRFPVPTKQVPGKAKQGKYGGLQSKKKNAAQMLLNHGAPRAFFDSADWAATGEVKAALHPTPMDAHRPPAPVTQHHMEESDLVDDLPVNQEVPEDDTTVDSGADSPVVDAEKK